MSIHNPKNVRALARYLRFQKEAMGKGESTLDGIAATITRFERFTNYRDFQSFTDEVAVQFKRHLGEQEGPFGQPLSPATLKTLLGHLRLFFRWLSREPGFRSRLTTSHAEYLRLSTRDARVAQACKIVKGPSVEHLILLILNMPSTTLIERRNQALFAFILITGCRDGALASLKLKHVNIEKSYVFLDASEVKTKYAKSFRTYFVPIDSRVTEIFEKWFSELADIFAFNMDAPLFPCAHVQAGYAGGFEAIGVKSVHWTSGRPVRQIFRDVCRAAGVPYFNPHSMRNSIVRFAMQAGGTPESFKAFSQNLGHENVLTTLMSYGTVSDERQAELVASMKIGGEQSRLVEELAKVIRAYGVP